jgi:LmbE family N-acetylglucosaminyl deacetylase
MWVFERIMKVLLSILACLLSLSAAEALPEDRGATGLWQSLLRLRSPARVLYVTAHPDDEDPALVTYLSRGLGCEVTMLILNRGEGGANVVSGDFFEALGALRSVEMLRAARQYGVDVRFTRAVDYGYSKNIDEAFRAWKQEELLADMVTIARAVKPHIVISRFNDSERDGHGHHQAAGRLAKMLFARAATPDWKPAKLYTSNWREGEAVTLKIDAGKYDPVLGRSYAQAGREGYRWHRSQGMASNVARPGAHFAYLKREDATVATEASILDGLALKRDAHIEAAIAAFDAPRPEKCAPHIAAALEARPEDARLSAALALALGLDFEALVEPEPAPAGPYAPFRSVETIQTTQPGQSFRARLTLHQRGADPVDAVAYSIDGPASVRRIDDRGGFELATREDARATSVSWSRGSVSESMYRLSSPAELGKPLPDWPFVAQARFSYRGAKALLRAPLEATSGAVRRPLAVAPPVSVRFESNFAYATPRSRSYSVWVAVRNVSAGALQGSLALRVPRGMVPPEPKPFAFSKGGEQLRLRFDLSLAEQNQNGLIELRALASVGGREFAASFEPITQPGFETAYLSRPALHSVRIANVRFASGLKVGYVMGSGDEVPEGLRQLGLDVEMLDAAYLSNGDLSKFHTIMIGIRAYAVRDDLRSNNARLLDFAAKGGAVIVQYQTQEFDRNYGPYPYTQGRNAEEVSEEDAPVRILKPDHPVFQFPNRIVASDFDAWIEQRGSKFFTTWDPAWTPLLETHDRSQAPQHGVCLAAATGKGQYVYCALSFYRQLPFAVPGAARLLANLVSLGTR